MPFPFAAVLFDLDGVLIDTTELHYRVWSDFAAAHGVAVTPADLLATNGKRAEVTVRLWLGDHLDDAAVAALTADREATFHRWLATEPASAVAGAAEYVAALSAASVRRAVVTSAIPANAELSLRRIGLREAFETVVTAADVRRGKPDPEPYLTAAARLGVAAADCVVFEDSVMGLRAGRAAGAAVVAVATTFPPDGLAAERPDWIISDFRGLPPTLRVK